MPEEQRGTAAEPSITIREARPDDVECILEIRNELRAPYPPETIEEFRFDEGVRREHPESHIERYVAIADGTAIASAKIDYAWEFDVPGAYWTEIHVSPQHWGQGTGARLYDLLWERACALGANRLYAYAREDRPRALHFAEARGFAPTGHYDRMSRLDVSEANLEGYDGLEERLRREGVRIVPLSETDVEDQRFLRAVYELDFAAARDIPGAEDFNIEPFDMWRRGVLEAPGMVLDAFFVALDGRRPVGLAALQRRGANTAYNWGTCVDRAYRGRGVARALKKRTIDWARANGVDFILTGNDVENRRMLDINIRLGYQPMPSGIEMIKRRSAEF